ncbi:hypothetical protein C8R44DRAFT_876182 [Mycena epipterygia]|nr:hypothetical protein C8R44DRAFT_876182 [Mycena epipterygia]
MHVPSPSWGPLGPSWLVGGTASSHAGRVALFIIFPAGPDATSLASASLVSVTLSVPGSYSISSIGLSSGERGVRHLAGDEDKMGKWWSYGDLGIAGDVLGPGDGSEKDTLRVFFFFPFAVFGCCTLGMASSASSMEMGRAFLPVLDFFVGRLGVCVALSSVGTRFRTRPRDATRFGGRDGDLARSREFDKLAMRADLAQMGGMQGRPRCLSCSIGDDGLGLVRVGDRDEDTPDLLAISLSSSCCDRECLSPLLKPNSSSSSNALSHNALSMALSSFLPFPTSPSLPSSPPSSPWSSPPSPSPSFPPSSSPPPSPLLLDRARVFGGEAFACTLAFDVLDLYALSALACLGSSSSPLDGSDGSLLVEMASGRGFFLGLPRGRVSPRGLGSFDGISERGKECRERGRRRGGPESRLAQQFAAVWLQPSAVSDPFICFYTLCFLASPPFRSLTMAQYENDNDIGVAVIDRYTHYVLEYMGRINKTSRDTVLFCFVLCLVFSNTAFIRPFAAQFASYDPTKIHSDPGVRADLFALDSVRLTDFFGGVVEVEVGSTRQQQEWDEDLAVAEEESRPRVAKEASARKGVREPTKESDGRRRAWGGLVLLGALVGWAGLK